MANEETKNEEVETPTPATDAWTSYVTPFADALGLTVTEVAECVKNLVGEPNDEAIALLENPADTTDQEIISRFAGKPMAKVRKAVKLLRKEQVVEEVPATSASAGFDILPTVPNDESFLEALKTNGELKIGKTEVISAVRAALAKSTGLFDVPNVLVKRMEQFANEQEEPCGEGFYKLQKMITRREYAQVLSAIDVSSSCVSEARKKQLLERIDGYLWPALISFQEQLSGWFDTWNKGAMNPNMMMAMMVNSQTPGAALPPNMMQPPETSAIIDASEGVVDTVNKVFAGLGIPVSRALAWDANNIKAVLENPSLPSQIGCTSKDMMLKTLKLSVSSDYVRLEHNLTRYILGIMGLNKVTSGNEELSYITALCQLGGSIPWSELGVSRRNQVDPVRGPF